MLGKLKLPVRGTKHYVVLGGPYIEKPKGMVGVKMAKEVPLAHDAEEIDIPTRDFHIPDVKLVTKGLHDAVVEMAFGSAVYVGCMGGKGRTGLFMAILAKAFGEKNPVEYVRANYYKHAVETPQQYKYVEDFVVPWQTRYLIKALQLIARFRRADCLTYLPTGYDKPVRRFYS